MTRSFLFLILSSLPLACSPLDLGDSEGPVLGGGRSPYVVNGQPHSGHPSAGQLTHNGSLCTATLIGKKTVLTAAHCVTPGMSHTFSLDGVDYPSASVKQHESYSEATISDDIALVILQQAPSVTPCPIAITAPSVGQEITIVGFGKTSEYASNAGVKRMATAKIQSVKATQITIPASQSSTDGNLCNGDSGGPSYAVLGGVEVTVGVHSTKAGACGDGGTDTRVDAYQTWITQNSGGDVVKPGSDPNPNPNPNPSPSPTDPTQDTQAPSVVITYPAANARVPASFSVTSQVTDNVGVARVELLVDGVVISSNSGASFTFPVVLKAGKHNLHLRAYDAANNLGEQALDLTVDGGVTPSPAPNPTPDPTAKAAFGASCGLQSDCQSGLCADDLTLGMKYCTQTCSTASPCPSGATCFGTSNKAMQVCGLPENAKPGTPGAPFNPEDGLIGTCSVSPGPLAATWPLVLLGLVALRLRRRSA